MRSETEHPGPDLRGRALAEQLVRLRSRSRAASTLEEQHPATFERLELAHRLGAARFPVTYQHYLDTVLQIAGRLWRRMLRDAPHASFRDAVAKLDGGSFLADLCALCQGMADPPGAATAFYRAFPHFETRTAQWWRDATKRTPQAHVDLDLFHRKCHGAALYHLLTPMRASGLAVPRVRHGFENDPTIVMPAVEARGWHHDLYFACALGQADTYAVEHFPVVYGKVLHGLLRRYVADGARRAELLDDFRVECILGACNYFGGGPFAGWLWFQCRTYMRRWRSPRGHSPRATPLAVSEHAYWGAGSQEAIAIVERALARLTAFDHRILREYWIERRTLRQLADELGRHLSTAIRHRNGATKRFRAILCEEARAVLGELASDEDCRAFLLHHAAHLDFGFAPVSEAAVTVVSDEPDDPHLCPLVPCRIP